MRGYPKLRLLGLTFGTVTITQMVTSLRLWKRLGGTIMIATGLLLATSEAEKYAPNPFSSTKMIILGLILLHGFIFRPIVYNQTEKLDRSAVIPTKVKLGRDYLAGPLDRHVHHGKAHRLLGVTSPRFRLDHFTRRAVCIFSLPEFPHAIQTFFPTWNNLRYPIVRWDPLVTSIVGPVTPVLVTSRASTRTPSPPDLSSSQETTHAMVVKSHRDVAECVARADRNRLREGCSTVCRKS